MDRLERSIEAIQNTIEKMGGTLVVKMKVRSPSYLMSYITYLPLSPKLSLRTKNRILRSSWRRLAKRMLRYLETRKRKNLCKCHSFALALTLPAYSLLYQYELLSAVYLYFDYSLLLPRSARCIIFLTLKLQHALQTIHPRWRSFLSPDKSLGELIAWLLNTNT